MWTTNFAALVSIGLTIAALTLAEHNSPGPNDRHDRKALHLTTSVIAERYCSDGGTTFLEWTLKLEYTNRGDHTLLLDRNSARVSRTFISRDVQAAAAGRYLYKPTPVYADLTALGFRPTPDPESFITLKPAESFSTEASCRVSIYDGTSDTEEDLRPGSYVLQVIVGTWRYYAESQSYREKWRERGNLWSEEVVSEPMPITTQRQPKVGPCSQ